MAADLEAVKADADSTPEGVSVDLVTDTGTTTIVVPPPGRWRSRANGLLQRGLFEDWAELVLDQENYQAWLDADPTNDDVEKFFLGWRAAAGEDPGKSRASQRSSRNTARR